MKVSSEEPTKSVTREDRFNTFNWFSCSATHIACSYL